MHTKNFFNMKRMLTLLAVLAMAASVFAQQRAKYVFFFIGDGMGVNQVNASETYLGAIEGKIGTTPLCFPSFPNVALVNTQSATNGVTDSAAGGTALATGSKTKNGTLGMLEDGKTPITSIAYWAQQAGAAVGVATSVSVDHATPGAFYAHVPDRGMYYTIGQQLCKTNYDFFGGSDFLKPTKKDSNEPDLYKQAADAGYTIARGYADYQKKAKKSNKLILLQTEEASKKDRNSLPYAIDRDKKAMTLQDITRAGINYLTAKNKDGFFLMIEGGKIDWACHDNDAATVVKETIDMDYAVRVAYEFYMQHPDETLIVVTADHETGGMGLGTGAYELHLDRLRTQNQSIGKLGKELHSLREKAGDKYNYEMVKNYLTKNFGFWTSLKISERQNKRLETAFDRIQKGIAEMSENLYSKDDELAVEVRRIMSEQAMVSWASYSHSNGYVPCFAIGVGAENFNGRIDNTDIPKRMAKAAGWEMK